MIFSISIYLDELIMASRDAPVLHHNSIQVIHMMTYLTEDPTGNNSYYVLKSRN